jgi:hypothetical protein
LHDIKRNDGSLVAQGCSHGDGDDDLSGVMPEHNDDDGRVHEPALGACRGGADLAPTSMCGGGYHGGEDLERVSVGHCPPASTSLHDGDGDGDDDGDGSDEGTEHQHCGSGQG